MPSEIGQICRTAAQQAMSMKSPCIQITPVFPNNLEEWARLYFYFSELTKSVEEKTKLTFLVDIQETGAELTQCPDSDNGFHEFTEIKDKKITNPTMLCIHCGYFAAKTVKTSEQLKDFFANKQFKRKEIPRADKDDSPF